MTQTMERPRSSGPHGKSKSGSAMRRSVGPLLGALGAFLLVVGGLGRFYAVPHLSVVPSDQNSVTSLSASGATVFDTSTLKDITTDLSVKARTVGNVEASKAAPGNTVVWVNSTTVTSADGVVRSQSTESVPFDATTAEAVNCCGATSFDEATAGQRVNVTRTGLVFKMPFNTQKKTYQMWDDTLRKAVPASYAGSSAIQGMTVYRFVSDVPGTVVGTQQVPVSVLGLPGTSNVDADSYYQNRTTYYVEPNTGAVINQVNDEKTWLQTGDHQLVTLEGVIGYTPAQISTMVDQVKSKSAQLALARGFLPWLVMLLGLGLLAGGAVLERRRV